MFGPAGGRGRGAAPGDPFAGFGGGFGDLFEAIFRGVRRGGGGGGRRRTGPRKGEDAEAVVMLDFGEAVFGVQREITVRFPTAVPPAVGRGAGGDHPDFVQRVPGTGELRRVRQSFLGQMVTATPCHRCGGTGEEITSPCPDCRGDGRRPEERTFVVDVPAGVDEGSTLGYPDGAGGLRGGPQGSVRARPGPRPQNADPGGIRLLAVVHVAMTQAALGVTVPFESLDGHEDLAIPAGTRSGREIRLRGRGVPHLQGRGRGDLIVTVVVDTPEGLTKEQDELLRRLAELRGEPVAAPEGGLMSKLRGAFK